MKRLIHGLAVLVLLLGGIGNARAGYAIADTSAIIGGTLGQLDSGVPTLSTPISSSNYVQDSFGGGPRESDANVSFISSPDQFLTWRAHSGVQMTLVNDQNDYTGGTAGWVEGKATWSDVLFLSNTNPDVVGHTLRLNFFADLTAEYSGVFGPSSAVNSGVSVSGTNVANPSSSDYATTSAGDGLNFDYNTFTLSTFFIGGFDTLTQFPDGSYHGTFHLDIPIVPGGGYIQGVPGSFFYSVVDDSLALVYTVPETGEGSVAFADPNGFSSISLPDVGNVTPESLGVSVTFASGIVSPNLSPSVATPEPSTLTLLGIGALGMFGYGWRRCKQVDA